MRKQTKLVAVLTAAALVAIGASMTSFAAGWEKEDYLYFNGKRLEADDVYTYTLANDGSVSTAEGWLYLNNK